MSEVVLTNLSNKLFNSSRFLLNETSKQFGITKIKSFEFEELKSTEFYEANKAILSHPTGIGYWLWKPYIILEAFKEIQEGDIVIYSDCGIEITGHLTPLINLCQEKTDILLFANSNFTNKIWTKRDCFVLMNCDEDKYWNGIHCDASFCLFKKCERSLNLLNEWLYFGCNENIITDLPNISGKENFPEFIDHRRDQSILSLLAIKHGIEFYRTPTQFGNHYKIKEYRILGEFNCINQLDYSQLNFYASHPFNNSLYPQLLNHHRKKNDSDKIEIRSTKKNFFMRNKIKYLSKVKRTFKKIKNFNNADSNKVNPHTSKSYSQCGEDLIVQYIFKLRGIQKPSYIDIGANSPFYLSNTALFYEIGCRGINIEANPGLIEDFKQSRPEDINLNIGVSDKEEELEFYIMKDNTLSTFSKEECDFMLSNGKPLAEVKKIKLNTISNILLEYSDNKFPDFMSLDVEGMDFDILRSIDFNNSVPRVICVEAADYSPTGSGARKDELIQFLVSKGYYEYANTNLNAIMVRKDFWFI